MTSKASWSKEKLKRAIIISAILAVCCGVMAVVDGVLKPPYAVKSAVKILLFLAGPLIYALFDADANFGSLFKLQRRGLSAALLLGLCVYIAIIAAYFTFRGVFDFSGITGALAGNAGVTKENFVGVALYISLVNSTLEEFFFRGFAFFSLKRFLPRRPAYFFSATVFALYHIAIMSGWFSIGVFSLTLAGLVAGGMIFNYLDEKYESLYPSMMVHLFANLAINTTGLILFKII